MAPGSFGFTSTTGLQERLRFHLYPQEGSRNLRFQTSTTNFERKLRFHLYIWASREASVSPLHLGPLERPRFHPIWGLSRGLGFTSTFGLSERLRFHLTPKPKPPEAQTNFEKASVSPNLGFPERPRFHPIWGPSRGFRFTQFGASPKSFGFTQFGASRGLGFTQFGAPPKGLGFTQFGASREASVSPSMGLERLRFHPISGSPKSFGFTQFGASREASVSPN